MKDIKVCKECGEVLGQNKDCQTCLRYLFEHGRQEITEQDVHDAINSGERWFEERGKSAPRKLFAQANLLWTMIKDYTAGEYRKIPWTTIASVTFALLYIINPFDLMPDFIPVFGWLDDTAIILLVISSARDELRKYCDFRGLNPADFGL